MHTFRKAKALLELVFRNGRVTGKRRKKRR
jgi:hypothetical protein